MQQHPFVALWQNVYIRATIIALSLFVIFILILKLRAALIVISIAFLIAYLLNPIVTRFSKLAYINRGLATTLCMLILLILISFALLALAGIVTQALTIPEKLIPSLRSLDSWLRSGTSIDWLRENYIELSSSMASQGKDMLQNGEAALKTLQNTLFGVLGSIGHLFESIVQFFLLFFLTAFMLAGFPQLLHALLSLFPSRLHKMVCEIGNKADITIGGYIRAKLIEATIMGFLVWACLSLIGIPQAASLALIAALFNPVPYIGPFISTITATLMALTVGWIYAFITFIVMTALEQLDGNFIAPTLLSHSIDISPILVISSLLIGGALLGFWGMLIAVPIAAFVNVLIKDYYFPSRWYNKN